MTTRIHSVAAFAVLAVSLGVPAVVWPSGQIASEGDPAYLATVERLEAAWESSLAARERLAYTLQGEVQPASDQTGDSFFRSPTYYSARIERQGDVTRQQVEYSTLSGKEFRFEKLEVGNRTFLTQDGVTTEPPRLAEEETDGWAVWFSESYFLNILSRDPMTEIFADMRQRSSTMTKSFEARHDPDSGHPCTVYVMEWFNLFPEDLSKRMLCRGEIWFDEAAGSLPVRNVTPPALVEGAPWGETTQAVFTIAKLPSGAHILCGYHLDLPATKPGASAGFEAAQMTAIRSGMEVSLPGAAEALPTQVMPWRDFLNRSRP